MSGERILVTGGAGFIGSHVVRAWLSRHPSGQLVNLDRLTYAASRERLADVERLPRYRFVQGDLCDPRAVREAMQGCQAVLHLAAETHVDRSITDAAPFLRTNIEGTYVLLEQAAALGIARVLHVSTDEVYGPVAVGAVDESAPLAPTSPYAASKAAGDLLVRAFAQTAGLPVIIARPTNIFGPGQFPEKFIALCITHALEGRPVPIYGDGRQRRSWLFVSDLCEALERILEDGRPGEIYNVAGGRELANADTARAILRALRRSEELLEFVADRPAHDRRYAMQDGKLRSLGWRPTVDFAQGLRDTVTWYGEHAAWWRPLADQLREDPYHWLNRTARRGPEPILRAAG